MKEPVRQAIYENKIIAIARGVAPELIVDAAKALYAGGIRLLEITFDQSARQEENNTTQMIKALRAELGDKMMIGAGTVITTQQAEQAAAAGAQFLLSAVVNGQVIARGNELGLVTIPGAFTPSEIQEAQRLGADFVKLFPAGQLGPGYIKAVKAPLSDVQIIAVGGIDNKNLCDYLAAGAAGVGVGSCLVNNKLIKQRSFDELAKMARAYVDALK